jgi:hypothetical protein
MSQKKVVFGTSGNKYNVGGTAPNATFQHGVNQGGSNVKNTNFSYGGSQGNVIGSNQTRINNAALGLISGQTGGVTVNQGSTVGRVGFGGQQN